MVQTLFRRLHIHLVNNDNGAAVLEALDQDGKTVTTELNRVVGKPVARGTVTLVGGTKVVNDPKVTANTEIRLFEKTPGGTVGAHYLKVKTASTSFEITSTSATDTSVVGYEILSY